jgi:DNA-binding CsgD family transcriptional regulator/tetratricopeptide (TPR) repeat protein
MTVAPRASPIAAPAALVTDLDVLTGAHRPVAADGGPNPIAIRLAGLAPPVRPEPIGTMVPMGLLERSDELAELLGRARCAHDGHGALILVTGEPGAGKTTLLQAFADTVGGELAVLWGACDPLSTPRPLGPLHDVAAHLDDTTRGALSEARQPHVIFASVHEHLRSNPSVLVVDDLHWADQGTIDLLRFLLRRIGSTSSLVVGALRDEELDLSHPLRSLLGDVARSPDAATIRLQPFSIDAITQLIDDRPVDPIHIAELTGGNPFFVTEMLDHVGDDLPASVRDAVLARTTHLDAEAWDLLHLLACSPEAIPDHLLPSLGVGFAPLRSLDQAGLIRRGPRGVSFRHDLCRLAVADAIPPGGDAPLHRRMLDALEASPVADPAVLAHHAVGAGDPSRILRHATAAGRAAARAGAHTQAAAFLRIALEQGPPLEPAAEAELLESLASECYLIDELDDAIAASDRALVLRARAGDTTGMSANHHSLAVFEWYNADRAAAERHVSDAVAVLGTEDEARAHGQLSQLGHAIAMQAHLAMHESDVSEAQALISRARTIATGADDPRLTARSSLIDGMCSVMRGDGEARRSMLTILGSSHENFDEVYSSGYSNLSYVDIEQRRLREASELLDISLPLTIERDLPICRAWQLGSRGRLNLVTGAWDAALADVDAVLAGPSAPLALTWPHLVRGLLALRRGVEDAEPDLAEGWELACRFGEAIRLLPVASALVEQAWLLDRDDQRLDRCRSLLGVDGIGLEWGRGDLAVWLRRLDPDADLGDVDDVAEPYRLELAGRHRDAATVWGELSCPYERAMALVGSGDVDDARAGLDELDRLGAVPVAAKARLGLRRRGVSAVPARRRSTTRQNPAGLTNRELEVLGLMAEGLTNAELAERLYISPKTVDHHVSAVLAKLQVPNRRDAVRRGRADQIID